MKKIHLTVVGDALLDRDLDGHVERLCPEAPVPVVDELAQRSRPGGAALAAALAAAEGHDVTLVTALSRDDAGRQLRALIEQAGVRVVDVGLRGSTPEKIRVRSDGRLLLRLDRGGRRPPGVGPAPSSVDAALTSADGVLVSDYGHGVATEPLIRRQLERAASALPLAWDPHPRGAEPVVGAALLTPNAREAAALVGEPEGDLGTIERHGRALGERWSADAVAVTMGENGAMLVELGRPRVMVPAPPLLGGDPCGAGDRFAATAAARLGAGETPGRAVVAAVSAASAFVAAGGAGGFTLEPQPPAPEEAVELAAHVRSRGGRVIATGGCFDLLHVGHLSALEAARALGDCLIVCLNSDDSARRLKGPDRPLVPQEERAALLRSLRSVDAVLVFDEDTPERALARLRPDVFAKGGDYTVDELPEARLLAEWGGEAVILPYVEGRSTTGLLAEVAARVG
jgi:D-beta-D-heptose 7-phosphate kinase / D-beta-D-heptose 1-phosphate adenosyltransferase